MPMLFLLTALYQLSSCFQQNKKLNLNLMIRQKVFEKYHWKVCSFSQVTGWTSPFVFKILRTTILKITRRWLLPFMIASSFLCFSSSQVFCSWSGFWSNTQRGRSTIPKLYLFVKMVQPCPTVNYCHTGSHLRCYRDPGCASAAFIKVDSSHFFAPSWKWI